jgi:hypothetical protein
LVLGGIRSATIVPSAELIELVTHGPEGQEFLHTRLRWTFPKLVQFEASFLLKIGVDLFGSESDCKAVQLCGKAILQLAVMINFTCGRIIAQRLSSVLQYEIETDLLNLA